MNPLLVPPKSFLIIMVSRISTTTINNGIMKTLCNTTMLTINAFHIDAIMGSCIIVDKFSLHNN
jgi:hypothetical protein